MRRRIVATSMESRKQKPNHFRPAAPHASTHQLQPTSSTSTRTAPLNTQLVDFCSSIFIKHRITQTLLLVHSSGVRREKNFGLKARLRLCYLIFDIFQYSLACKLNYISVFILNFIIFLELSIK